MSVDLSAVLRDKRVQIGGVAAAGLAGAVVWYRSKHATPASSSSSDATSDGSDSTTPAAYAPGSFPDTSGSDVASWLGSNETAFTQELADYLQQIQDATGGTGTSTPPPSETFKNPVPMTPPKVVPTGPPRLPPPGWKPPV